MSKRKDSFGWMLAAKNFIGLLGVEFSILHRSGTRNMVRFYFAGVAVLFILTISFASVFYALDLMFHKKLPELLLATFLSSLFGIMYVFLIHTFSKEVVKRADQTPVIVISNMTRIGFVLFLGFIIAQPVSVFMLQSGLNKDIDLYREKLIAEYSTKINQLYSDELSVIDNRIALYTELSYKGTEMNLAELNDKKERLIKQNESELIIAKKRIQSSDFLTKRIQLAALKYPLSWLIVIIVMLLFLTPVYLIYSISSENVYFVLKRNAENMIIDKDYQHFKQVYSKIFEVKYGMKGVVFYESFSDPPYNLTSKKPSYLTEKDFLKQFFPEA